MNRQHEEKRYAEILRKATGAWTCGKYVADRLLPVCDSIRVLEKKLLRNRNVFPLKDGQRYAGRIRVYRVLRNHKTTPHGIYFVDNGKLKKMKRMTFVEFDMTTFMKGLEAWVRSKAG